MYLPMLNRSVVMLGVALLAGLLAAWAAQQHIQGRILQIEHDARVPQIQRVVAAFDLPAGTKLDTEHMAIRQLPAAVVSSDSIAPQGFPGLVGQTLVAPLRAGDLILPVHTAQARSTPFSDQLGTGRRAITMPVDAINSVSGLLEPGDLIDLYVSFEHQRRRMTAPLLQGVLVLATGTQTRSGSDHADARGAGAYSTVTLDTSPEDAVKLVAARQGGTITALLRRPDDNRADQKAVRGDLASLIGVNTVPASNSAKRRSPQVIYGNQSARSLPALRPSEARPVARNGVFDLPYTPDLVSAWLSARQNAQAAVPAGFTFADVPMVQPENTGMPDGAVSHGGHAQIRTE
ncbi:MAG: Flp pilus assembly protein CpaB [Burkholderiaceae bacterium]|nr:MAG: Flp pilus assembly protein CpaB [Burkholderiaceae bacterium]TAM04871.1 MAG: Flp pilus assembly protein CpaB [Pusillimonas sp.]